MGLPDWRQSCQDIAGVCHPGDDGDPTTPAIQPGPTESSKGLPYGTKIADTLGSPNFLTGDYNKDGVVDAADYTVWRNTFGQAGTETAHPTADPNHDFLVDEADYAIWKASYGSPFSTPGPGAGSGGLAAVPEPTSFILAVLAMGLIAARQRLR
jgi:hypothetical protein